MCSRGLNIVRIKSVMNKNEWICKIISDKKYCEEEIGKLSDGVINKAYLSEVIDCEIFHEMIKRASEKHIGHFLSEYSLYANAEEITPSVFNALLKCDTDFKESILIGLCHSDISFYQLLILDDLSLTDEAVLQLIKRCFNSDVLSMYDLEMLLKRAEKYKYHKENVKYIADELGLSNLSEGKQVVLKKFLR